MMFYKKKTSAPSSSASPSLSHPGLKPLRLVEKLVASDIIQPYTTLPTLDVKKNPRSAVQGSKRVSASARPSLGARKPRLSSAGQTPVGSKRAPFVVPLNYSAPRAPRAMPTIVTRPVRSSGEDPAARRKVANTVSRQVHKVSRSGAKLPVSLLATPSKPAPAPVVAAKSISKPVVAEKSTSNSTFQSRLPVFVGRGSFSKPFTPSSTPRISISRIPRLRYTGRSPATSRSSRSNCSVSSIISSNAHTPCPSPILVVEARPMAPRIVSMVEAAFPTSDPAPQERPTPVDLAKVTEDATSAMEVAQPTVSDCLVILVEAGSPEIGATTATESIVPPPSCKTLPARGQSHGAQPTLFAALFAELKASHPKLRDVTATESIQPPPSRKTFSRPDQSRGPQPTIFSALFAELQAGHPKLRDVITTKSTPPPPSRLVDPKPPSHRDSSPGPQSTVLGALFAELKTKLSGSTAAKRPTSNIRPFILSTTSGNRRDKENIQVENELQKVFARRRSSAFGLSLKGSEECEHRVQERRPLVPVRLANHSRLSFSVPAGTPPPPPPACSPSSPPTDAADSTPPGAVYITELVNTAFGTRKVRRTIIPPMEDGARPSRDPRIVMELDRLRA
ncbi:hypothetical protein B0H11DRAFT_1376435 [Mycena galericulata]|nr:hypothetical protein B0H11DRAFT_1376435 [Mycena galericulata]